MFTSRAELRGAFLDVLADEAPGLLHDLWRDRDVTAWAARHGLRDAWIHEAARDTLAHAERFQGGACPSTFILDLPTDGGWTAETNSAGAHRPARPALPGREPGGLRRFLARVRQYRHRMGAWRGVPDAARWQVTPDHLRWCAWRLRGASWANVCERAGLTDVRLVRRRVRALTDRIGLTLP